MTLSHGFSLISLMRKDSPKLAHASQEAFLSSLGSIAPKWQETHKRRASFNWELIVEKMSSVLKDILQETNAVQITSHHLLILHERLDRLYRTIDCSIACSDAAQVALDLAIKAQFRPVHDQGLAEAS